MRVFYQSAKNIWAAVICCAAILSAELLPAQAPEGTAANSSTAAAESDDESKLTIAEVEARKKAVEEDTALDDAIKSSLRSKYEEAIAALRQAAEFDGREADFRNAIESGPSTTAQLRAELESLPATPETAVPAPTVSGQDLQTAVTSERARLNGLKEELARVTSELASLKGRPVDISERLPKVERELSERGGKPDATGAEESTSPSKTADQTLREAERRRLVSESRMLAQEQASLAIREELLQARQALLTRQVDITAAGLDALEAQSTEQLKSEALEVGALADTTPEGLPSDDKAALDLAAEVQQLAKELATAAEDLESVKKVKDEITSRRNRLTEEFDTMREQLRWGVGGGVSAQVLFDLEQRVVSGRQRTRAAKYPSLEESLLSALQISEKTRQHPEVTDQFSDHPAPAVGELVAARADVLKKLSDLYSKLTRDLAALEGEKQQYFDKCVEVADYVREQLFWMRSSPPLGVESLTDVPANLQRIVGSDQWQKLARVIRLQLTRMPVRTIGFLVLLVTLVFARPRIGAALEQTAQGVRRISTDRFGHTYEAFLWTLLLAAPLPLLLGFWGWSVSRFSGPSEVRLDFAAGIQLATRLTFVAEFLRAVFRPGGLGAAHFGWHEETLRRLRKAIVPFAIVYVPCMLFSLSFFTQGEADAYDSIGRVLFIACHIWTAVVLWRLLCGADGVLTSYGGAHPGGLIARWRFFWTFLVLAGPLALLWLAARGYLITATELSLGFCLTTALIATGIIAFHLMLRWFNVRRRKIALAEALERRHAQQQVTAADSGAAGEVVSVDPEEDERLDLESVSAQTRALLKLVFSLIVGAIALYLWSETIPFISAFDSVSVPLTGERSLLVVFEAALIAVATIIFAHNLPGLLELAGLREATIQPGTRYAVTTICKYVVYAVGLILLCNVWQVDWAKFGWIAAALSVGLGFGLQEIVANFVCGLIILFEQPIRVGDVVTLENTTGTVTRIRMRSTTITNWDRQDFVVPNKNLITGTILNWTLSAAINRVVIPVGVAYGSNTEEALQILLDVATDNPRVLTDPAPIATFEQFADSTLNLVLRTYLPDLENRLATISELHSEIDKRFAAAGIEIAFPQRDLNLRRGWEDFAAADLNGRSADEQSPESAGRHVR